MAAMRCPRCNTDLQKGRYEQAPASRCPSCNGAFIEQRYLTRILDKLSKDLFDNISVDTEIPITKDSGAVSSCPACYSEMEYYGYMGSNKVMIDYCNQCRQLWIDALEFAAMAQMYARVNKIRESERSKQDDGADLVNSQRMTEALTHAFLLNFAIID